MALGVLGPSPSQVRGPSFLLRAKEFWEGRHLLGRSFDRLLGRGIDFLCPPIPKQHAQRADNNKQKFLQSSASAVTSTLKAVATRCPPNSLSANRPTVRRPLVLGLAGPAASCWRRAALSIRQTTAGVLDQFQGCAPSASMTPQSASSALIALPLEYGL
jgi:hypothetical protein